MSWYSVCSFERLPVERAVCVLVGGEQVALVRTRENALYAVDNLDPVSEAMVMLLSGVLAALGAWIIGKKS